MELLKRIDEEIILAKTSLDIYSDKVFIRCEEKFNPMYLKSITDSLELLLALKNELERLYKIEKYHHLILEKTSLKFCIDDEDEEDVCYYIEMSDDWASQGPLRLGLTKEENDFIKDFFGVEK